MGAPKKTMILWELMVLLEINQVIRLLISWLT